MKKSKKEDHPSPNVWIGGKISHIGIIRPYWEKHKHRRLIEPFSGSLSISFGLSAEKVLANDLNTQLINQYIELQKNPMIDWAMNNESELYYNCRTEFNKNITDYPDIFSAPESIRRRQAELFYYLNRYAFNGLYRENKKGHMNAPFANYKYSKAKNDLNVYFSKTKEWEFISGDFSAIKLNNNSDYVFADPPYVGTFEGYNKAGFNWQDQIRVCEWLRDFKGPAMICNQRVPETEKLYKEYGYQLLDARRPLNFGGAVRTEESKKEVIAIKNVEI